LLGGFRSAHLARQTADVGLWRAQIGSFAHLLAEMSANWGGWLPAEIDVGGGWPSPRDPVGRRAARARTRPLPSDVADYRVTETGPDIAALIGEDSVELEIADLDAGDGRIIELIRYIRPAGRPIRPAATTPAAPTSRCGSMTSAPRWNASKARKRARYRAARCCCMTRVAPGTRSPAAISLTRTGTSSNSSSDQQPDHSRCLCRRQGR